MLQMQLLYANQTLTKEKEYTCDYAQSHICIPFHLLHAEYVVVLLSFRSLRSKQEIIVHRFPYTRRVSGEITHIY